MTHEEKRAWNLLVVSGIAYAVYAAVLVGRLAAAPPADVRYADVMVWSIGGAIVAAVLAEIGWAVADPRADRTVDVRDREISRLADQASTAFLVIGSLAGLLLTVGGADRFWIANAIHLGFVLSAVIGSLARILLYRRGVPQW